MLLTLSDMDGLRDEVEAYLDGLGADEETKVSALVVEWDSVSLCVGSIDQGSVANIQGVSTSFEQMRAVIRERLMTYVPVMHMAEARARRNNYNSSQVEFGR